MADDMVTRLNTAKQRVSKLQEDFIRAQEREKQLGAEVTRLDGELEAIGVHGETDVERLRLGAEQAVADVERDLTGLEQKLGAIERGEVVEEPTVAASVGGL
jgi:predicted  nucleic acid-binding Zn-ribbon protein